MVVYFSATGTIICTVQLKDMLCILVAKKEYEELERGFYQNVLEIGNKRTMFNITYTLDVGGKRFCHRQ